MLVSALSESELIARIQARLPAPPAWLVVGIGDDAAVVEPGRGRLEVLTTDGVVEGVHFDRRFTPPDAIGHRALAVNLSDLAAMGAAPRLALLSLALPGDLPAAGFDGLIGGLAALAARHRMHIVGGNLTRSPGPIMVDVTAIGTVKRRRALTRVGARPGDEVYVTGSVGAAAAGLRLLQGAGTPAVERADAGCLSRYLYPEPRVRTGSLLSSARAASACMDSSDGLTDALHRIAQASGVGIDVEAGQIPVDPRARRLFTQQGLDPVLTAMAGGDDYELVFTVRPRSRGRLRMVRAADATPLTRIGVCTREGAVTLCRTEDGVDLREPVPGGYTHFLTS